MVAERRRKRMAEEEQLVFPNAVIVRELRKHIDKDKMIKKEVKIAVNRFLAEVLADIAKRMNQFPYATVDYRMFEEAVRPYKKVKELDKEKERMKAHLDVIIKDCQSIQRDLDEKLS